jgi:hypothetical protein
MNYEAAIFLFKLITRKLQSARLTPLQIDRLDSYRYNYTYVGCCGMMKADAVSRTEFGALWRQAARVRKHGASRFALERSDPSRCMLTCTHAHGLE